MLNRVVLIVTGFLAVIVVSGCSEPVSYQVPEPVCFTSVNQDRLMEAGEQVLLDMHFEIEKFDVEKGVIKTYPLRGGQFFEFWRSDNVGSQNKADSNLYSILRSVDLQVTEKGTQHCLEITSRKRRLSIPEQELVSGSQNAGIFTGGSVNFQKIRLETENLEWIEMGRDYPLENRILDRIADKISDS